jgi:hypothetical protein
MMALVMLSYTERRQSMAALYFRPLETKLARVYHTTSPLHNGGGRRPLGSSLKVKRGFVTSRQPRKDQELFDF